jgi:hypothetical protein
MTTTTRITGEVATPVPGGWLLKNTPAGMPTCYLNGLKLSSPQDFSVFGNTIVSQYWSSVTDPAADVLTVDYSF